MSLPISITLPNATDVGILVIFALAILAIIWPFRGEKK